MRIIYCIPEIYSSGGKERVLINKANWFARHGHEVIIITTEQKGRNAFYRLDANVRLVDIGINYWDNLQRPFLKKIYHYHSNRIRHFSRLRDCINKYKPDVVVSLFAQEMRHLVRMRDKSKKVLEYHFAKQRILDSRRKGMLFWWDSWNYLKILRQIRKFDRFVVLTDADRNSWGGRN